jgi:hemerythrin-like metal-binding protein
MHDGAPMEWSDSLLTGIDEVDRQHRILVDTLIAARAALNSPGAGLSFEQITRDLLAYAIYHFDTEEQLMQRHGYGTLAPEAAQRHLAQHRGFSARVVAMRADERQGNGAGAGEGEAALLAFLEGWLVNHILTTDHSLAHFICSRHPL